MASIRLLETSKGKCYEIQVCRGRGKSPYTTRWYPEKSWSDKYVEQRLNKAISEFEEKCARGEVKTRNELKAEANTQNALSEKGYTFKEYAEKVFIPAQEVTVSDGTIAAYNTMLRVRLNDAIGTKKIAEITTAELSQFLLNLQRGSLSTSSVIKYYSFLQGVFKKAYKEDVIDKNPMDRVDRPKKKKAEGKDSTVSAFTEEEVRRILKIMETEPLKWKAYVNLMLDTGMRRGECCGLQWEDINFENKQITVRHTLNYNAETKVQLSNPKNGMSRVIDISDEVVKLLQMLKLLQDASVQSQYVFTQEHSAEPMHPTSPVRYMKKIGKKHGIEGFHPHKLRHTWASIAITNGADIESVSEKLGHADAGFTLKQYTHANQASMRKASDVFRNAIKEVDDV